MKDKELCKIFIEQLQQLATSDLERLLIAKLERDLESPPVVHTLSAKAQEFNGRIYRTSRYNDHFGTLHRDVYSYYHGPIPSGYAIHHIDWNPANNSLDNLMCVTASEHGRLHRYELRPKK